MIILAEFELSDAVKNEPLSSTALLDEIFAKAKDEVDRLVADFPDTRIEFASTQNTSGTLAILGQTIPIYYRPINAKAFGLTLKFGIAAVAKAGDQAVVFGIARNGMDKPSGMSADQTTIIGGVSCPTCGGV